MRAPAIGVDLLLDDAACWTRMAEFAREWKEIGARIIGGCGASGPEHIMEMRPMVKGE